MNPIEKFERAIGRVFRAVPGQTREPIELRREVLREIADQVQPVGGGEYLFPFTGIQVELHAADGNQQGPLEAIFAQPGFDDDVNIAIRDRGCTPPTLKIEVAVKVTPQGEPAPAAPYRIAYQRSVPTTAIAAAPRPRARLVVVAGRAEINEIEIDRDLFYIGRLREVVNSETGLERLNHLAFDASESTVSRKHARLEYDEESGRFRLYNDPETTSVSRNGRGIPCDATRGVQLRSGDELVLGKARVRFEIV